MARNPDHSTSRNPLETDPEHENRVRERAYLMWEADGKPHGHDVEYWERARELVGMEESAGSGQVPVSQTLPDGVRESGEEDATVQSNLGEFPSGLVDQGEVETTPVPKRRSRSRAAKRG